ncbi:MAG: hypothetical protein J1E40_06320 [Oscillospiraceae bacterium]|nr:hypothetical protein [Oscillospiraceae bacterium]
MKKKQFISVIAAVTLCLAGCYSDIDKELVEQSSSDIQQTTADTEQINEETTDYDSDDWNFEKICALVEIDGTHLKFPCTLEEISNIDNNIIIENPDDGLGFYYIYYNNTNIGLISFDKGTGISKFILLYYYDDESEENIDGMTFAGYSAEQETEINNFMDETFKLSDDRSDLSVEDFYRKVYEFEQGNQKMEFTIVFNDSKLYLVRITLEDINNE